jgi:hypothetical protein
LKEVFVQKQNREQLFLFQEKKHSMPLTGKSSMEVYGVQTRSIEQRSIISLVGVPFDQPSVRPQRRNP